MPQDDATTPGRCPRHRTPDMRRWTLVGLGTACVGIGAEGVIVPGLPTTVFLIAASWCFTRSSPWLEERLIRNRLFRPYLAHLDSGQPMPKRAMWAVLAIMWTAITLSTLLLLARGTAMLYASIVPLLGIIGTACIVRSARSRRTCPDASQSLCEHVLDAGSTTASRVG